MQKVNKSGVETGVVSGVSQSLTGHWSETWSKDWDFSGKCGGEGLKGNWSAKRCGHWSQVGEVPRWVFQAP